MSAPRRSRIRRAAPVRLLAGAPSAVRQVLAVVAGRPPALLAPVGRDVQRLGLADVAPVRPDPAAARRYARQRAPLVLVAAVLVSLFLLVGAAYLVWSLVLIFLSTGIADLIVGAGVGVVLMFVGWQGADVTLRVERWLARRHLAEPETVRLTRRIDDLAASRAAVVTAVDDERRRIERDLHDGVQQRLVGLGMLLGRAQRSGDAERARSLLAQAHDESQELIRQLREVSWRVYPAELDHDGLGPALSNLALRAPLPVTVTGADVEVPVAVRTAVFFIASEALTNAVKHAQARHVELTVRRTAGAVTVRVRDDGIGGADAAGTGLSGLSRRAGALDGTLRVTSPVGGPTTIEAEVPCA